jgi:hypothetical protein
VSSRRRGGAPGGFPRPSRRSRGRRGSTPRADDARRLAGWRAEGALAFEPSATGTRDSDANALWRGAVAVALPATGRARATLAGAHARATGAGDTAGVSTATLGVRWQPRAALRLDASAGIAGLRAPASVAGGATRAAPVPVSRVAWRRSAPAGASAPGGARSTCR